MQKKYHTVAKVSETFWKQRQNQYPYMTYTWHMHDRILPWLGTGTSITGDGVSCLCIICVIFVKKSCHIYNIITLIFLCILQFLWAEHFSICVCYLYFLTFSIAMVVYYHTFSWMWNHMKNPLQRKDLEIKYYRKRKICL